MFWSWVGSNTDSLTDEVDDKKLLLPEEDLSKRLRFRIKHPESGSEDVDAKAGQGQAQGLDPSIGADR